MVVRADVAGVITYATHAESDDNAMSNIPPQVFQGLNERTCRNQPDRQERLSGQKGPDPADGPRSIRATGPWPQLLVAFMTSNGYNFEDSIVKRTASLRKTSSTSIHSEEYDSKFARPISAARVPAISPTSPSAPCPTSIERNRPHRHASFALGDILVGKMLPRARANDPGIKTASCDLGLARQDVTNTR